MPRLVIKQGVGVGRDHALSGGSCSVGRDPTADFPLEDPVASRRHFSVEQEGGVYWVQDLGSTNGTLLNGRKVTRAQLIDGDVIKAGATQVTFVQKGLLSPPAAGPVRKPPVLRPPPTQPPVAPSASTPPAEPSASPVKAPVPRRRRR